MIDELCKLVHENTYGKCSFCLLPTESLVLIVLQILLDAAQSADKPKENNVAPPIFVQKNRVNDNDKSVPSISRGINFFCACCIVLLSFVVVSGISFLYVPDRLIFLYHGFLLNSLLTLQVICTVQWSRSSLTSALLKEILKPASLSEIKRMFTPLFLAHRL